MTDPLRDGEQLYRWPAPGAEAGKPKTISNNTACRWRRSAPHRSATGRKATRIHPDYDTVPLRDVARLYAKYEALHKFHANSVRTHGRNAEESRVGRRPGAPPATPPNCKA
jgi:hypothetical protein